MQISTAAEQVGVPAHALRHWEDERILVPQRDAHGYRVYDDELIARGRLVVLLQGTGLTLREIGDLTAADGAGRTVYVERHRARLGEAMTRLARADAFLGHSLECRHPMVTECAECSGFADGVRAAR